MIVWKENILFSYDSLSMYSGILLIHNFMILLIITSY